MLPWDGPHPPCCVGPAQNHSCLICAVLERSVLSADLFDLENQILKCAWWTAVDLRSRSAATFVPTWQALEVMGQHISAIMPVLGHVSAITPVLGYAVLGVVHSRPWNFEHGICGPLWDVS